MCLQQAWIDASDGGSCCGPQCSGICMQQSDSSCFVARSGKRQASCGSNAQSITSHKNAALHRRDMRQVYAQMNLLICDGHASLFRQAPILTKSLTLSEESFSESAAAF